VFSITMMYMRSKYLPMGRDEEGASDDGSFVELGKGWEVVGFEVKEDKVEGLTVEYLVGCNRKRRSKKR